MKQKTMDEKLAKLRLIMSNESTFDQKLQYEAEELLHALQTGEELTSKQQKAILNLLKAALKDVDS